MRVIRFTQHLLSYSQNHPLPFSLWVQQYDEGGDDLWSRDEALSVSHDRLLAWLQRWEAVTLDEPDDDWLIEDESVRNAYIVAGGEGKTSLVTHLAHSLQYKVIEVNNADQEIASVISRVQEATQSRVIRVGGLSSPVNTSQHKGKNLKSHNEVSFSFSKCPVILIDDLDINIPASQPSLAVPSSITLFTSIDIYHSMTEKVGISVFIYHSPLRLEWDMSSR